MSTLHKVKAYFGMAPMDDYEDEYYDDRAPSRGFPRPRFDDEYGALRGTRVRRPTQRPGGVRAAQLPRRLRRGASVRPRPAP